MDWSLNLTQISHNLRFPLAQLRVFSHQLCIEIDHHLPRDQCICKLCNLDVEFEEHLIFTYPIYYEIRGRYYCLFRYTHTLKSWINYKDHRFISLFIQELFNLKKELLSNSLQRKIGSQLITSFFQPPKAMTKKC